MAEPLKCTIVSGAPSQDIAFLLEKADRNSFMIAADSGYEKLLAAGMRIDAIVADFDSSVRPDYDCEIITFPVEKEATDTFNAIQLAVERGYRKIDVFFALGGRFDHSYANLLCLEYCRRHGVTCTLIDRFNRVSLIEGRRTFGKEYQWFSLYAFLGDCQGVTIQGAHYTAGFYGKEELNLSPFDQFGQSNYIEGDTCTVSVREGTLLLIEANDR